ncbi:response regulator [Massilia sp. Root418]|jgi:CheY-like chemotaxis protein|uniref:response regulator n=1 Tax=Massilia sp. Root418 TaxID=1736532 RepID=UPI000A8F0AAD|nr:response regulator [Massilia sp. Root418]
MAARVLIVEDNQANMDLMCYLLEAFGHQPLGAYDGEQGVAAARAQRPDLIICDIHLPRLDGYGVVARLKADPATAAIPVLAASALPVSDGGAALRAAGFDGHLPKSLEPDTLIPSLELFLPPALRGHAPATADGQAPPAQPTAPPARAAVRVLLLDAAPDGGGLVASILAHYGYALLVAADAEQAALCARQPFDLLLCDADTAQPRHTAFLPAVLQRCQAEWEGVPLVLITSADGDALDGLLPPGVTPSLVLAHPLEPQQLAAALETCTNAALA